MKNRRMQSIALLATVLALPQAMIGAQDQKTEPQVQLKPAQVVQKPDAKSLLEKASFLIGFNFMTSAKEQPKANLEQIFEGMKAAASGQDRSSFIAGYQMMERIKNEGIDLNLDQIRSGMETAAANKELGMSQEEVKMLMQAFSKMVEDKRMAEMKAESAKNLAAGEAYIEQQKAANPGMKKLENGCHYLVLEQGSGPKPTVNDTVKVDYTGTFINGEVFDSSVKPPSGRPPQPAEFPVAGVVPGFSETLQNMQVGGKWRVIIPGPQAYGVQGRGSIGPNQTLIFEIELLEIVKQ